MNYIEDTEKNTDYNPYRVERRTKQWMTFVPVIDFFMMMLYSIIGYTFHKCANVLVHSLLAVTFILTWSFYNIAYWIVLDANYDEAYWTGDSDRQLRTIVEKKQIWSGTVFCGLNGAVGLIVLSFTTNTRNILCLQVGCCVYALITISLYYLLYIYHKPLGKNED